MVYYSLVFFLVLINREDGWTFLSFVCLLSYRHCGSAWEEALVYLGIEFRSLSQTT